MEMKVLDTPDKANIPFPSVKLFFSTGESRGVANSKRGGGRGHNYIFEFTYRESNRVQKKLIVQNMNI